MRNLVDFIGIGVQKAATSWLHDALARHPQVETSVPKELNFFTASYDRGYLWYERCFRSVGSAVRRGEFSPSYFCSRSAPLHAHAYNPLLRLVCVLRDPVERAFSNHLHEIRKGHLIETEVFEEALFFNPMYVEQGRYRKNLSRWLEVFGREALLMLLAEDIAADPATAFRQICTHLGVADDVTPDGVYERRHESVANHHQGLQSALRAGGDAARSLGAGAVVRAMKTVPGVRSLLALNRLDLRDNVSAMHPETAAWLAREFAEDMRFVADLLGRPDLPWQSWASLNAVEGMKHRVG